jgi:hypothetical protein
MVKNSFLVLILLVSLYFGSGGFLILQNDQWRQDIKPKIENGKEVSDEEAQRTALIEQTQIFYFYPYIRRLPTVLSFLITSICFGIIGAIAKMVNDAIKSQARIDETPNVLLIPLQGGLIGLIILGISYTLPVLLTNENTSLKPISIVFLSLLGGIYYINFFERILKVIDNFGNKD